MYGDPSRARIISDLSHAIPPLCVSLREADFVG